MKAKFEKLKCGGVFGPDHQKQAGCGPNGQPLVPARARAGASSDGASVEADAGGVDVLSGLRLLYATPVSRHNLVGSLGGKKQFGAVAAAVSSQVMGLRGAGEADGRAGGQLLRSAECKRLRRHVHSATSQFLQTIGSRFRARPEQNSRPALCGAHS